MRNKVMGMNRTDAIPVPARFVLNAYRPVFVLLPRSSIREAEIRQDEAAQGIEAARIFLSGENHSESQAGRSLFLDNDLRPTRRSASRLFLHRPPLYANINCGELRMKRGSAKFDQQALTCRRSLKNVSTWRASPVHGMVETAQPALAWLPAPIVRNSSCSG